MWVIRTLKENTAQNWARLIEDYLRCLDNKFGVEYYALKVTDSSDIISDQNIPQFYIECINYFQKVCREGRSLKHEDIIWSNQKYRFKDKSLIYHHWLTSGIIT